jgi:acyl-coenzyme A thioesterase PaaI-like protein
MSISDGISAARQNGDLQPLIEAVPYFRWMGLRVDRQGEELITVLPFQDMLIGNPLLPALHGGVTGALLESAAMISLIGAMDTPRLPKIVNITVEYLRPGGALDSFATGIVTEIQNQIPNSNSKSWSTRHGSQETRPLWRSGYNRHHRPHDHAL